MTSINHLKNSNVTKIMDKYPLFCLVAKTLRTNQKSVAFVKDASIFDDWKEETPQDTARALKHDFSLWKLEKIVPEESEQEKVKEIIIKHFFSLRSIFI